MMDKPITDDSVLLSIVIPAYNVEEYIGECLESVIGQDIDNYEIICVEDHSEDRTAEIITQYMQEYPFIRMYQKDQRGLGGCRNLGVSKARGKYIQFLDSDDVLMPDTLGMLTRHMEDGQLDAVFYSFENFLHQGSTIDDKKLKLNQRYHKGEYDSDATLSGVELLKEFHANADYIIAAWNCMIRKSYLTDHDITFNPVIIYEDWPFYMELLLKAEKVRCLNDVCIRRRIRKNAITRNTGRAFHIYSKIISVKEMYQVALKNQPVWEDCYEAVAGAMHIRAYSLCKDFRLADEETRNKVLSMCSAEDAMFVKSIIIPWSETRNSELKAKRKCKNLKQKCEELQKQLDKTNSEIHQ